MRERNGGDLSAALEQRYIVRALGRNIIKGAW